MAISPSTEAARDAELSPAVLWQTCAVTGSRQRGAGSTQHTHIVGVSQEAAEKCRVQCEWTMAYLTEALLDIPKNGLQVLEQV